VVVSGEIDTLTASRVGEHYYLAFGGKNGLKCRSRAFAPDARWELVEEGKDNGSCPVFYSLDGKSRAGGAKWEEPFEILGIAPWVHYDEIAFGDDPQKAWPVPLRRSVRMASPVPKHSFGSGTTFNLGTLPGGKTFGIYANVESRTKIELEEIESDEPGPITGLYLAYGRSAKAPPGFQRVPTDLNRAAGGSDIHLWYSRDPRKGQPITDLKVVSAKALPAGYEHTANNLDSGGPGDLNRGAGGAYLYLLFSRTKSRGAPIQMLDLLEMKDAPAPPGWEVLRQDLNEGAGGRFLYLAYTRH